MNRFSRRAIRVVVALTAVAITSVSTLAATDAAGGAISMTVEMVDAFPLRDGNIVRASGVKMGTIDSVKLSDTGKALVTMSLDRSILPLHQDARAKVIDQDLLGERYVSIDPGTPSSPEMATPYFIPAERASTVTDLQQVVDIVNKDAGKGLGMMMTALGEGLGTDPAKTAGTIAALEPSMVQTRDLAKVLSDQNEILSKLVATAEPVASAVTTNRGESLDRLVGSATNLLETTAAHRGQIQGSLDRLPGALQSANVTLGEVATLAPATTTTLRELRPLTDDLVDFSDELADFSDAADPSLDSLRPVLERGKKMLDELAPVADDLREGGKGLKGVANGYRRIADGGLSTRIVDLLEAMKGWAMATSDYDAYSHYFKAMLPYTPKTGAATAAGPIPGAPTNLAPGVPLPRGGRAPIPGGASPGAPSEGGPFLPKLPKGNHDAAEEDEPLGAIGLSKKQESDMMGQLLGGGR